MDKLIIKIAALLLLGASTALPASYTVKSSGGNYTTIQACANTAVAGDTCTVYAGTYNEVVALSHSGTGTGAGCTACITFQANPGDTVNVFGFTVSANYIIIKGFTITDPTFAHANAGVFFTGAFTGIQILNNTITQVGQFGYPCIHTEGSSPSHYLTITGNTISWCDSFPGGVNAKPGTAVELNADHSLFANNDISHTPNGIAVAATNNAVVGNYYHDVNVAAEFPGCHEISGCDTHVDMIEAGTTVNLLIEGNRQNNTIGVGGSHNALYSGAINGESVYRFNIVSNNGEGLIGIQNGYAGVHAYNNTAVATALEGAELGGIVAVTGWFGSSTNGGFLNNIMYNDVYPAGTTAYYYLADSSSSSGFASGHNLAFDSGCSAGTLVGCASGLMLSDSGNIYADPRFIDPAGDFRLQTGSPALGSGTYLTTVAAGDSGSGTTLIVNDAGFFQDGYGITGVNADWIRIGASATAQIASIDYATNTITLRSGISRSSGDPVYLYRDSLGSVVLSGATPDLGALPYSVIPCAITAPSLLDGALNVLYSQPVRVSGTQPIAWSITAGALPSGLSLDTATGIISGTPTDRGDFFFTVSASNASGSDSKSYILTIRPNPNANGAPPGKVKLNIR